MFTESECGCFADGAFGHDHVREVLAELLEHMYRHHPRGGPGLYWESDIKGLVEELRGPMSDDASEEYDALEWLNKCCLDDTSFVFSDGDLLLVDDAWED